MDIEAIPIKSAKFTKSLFKYLKLILSIILACKFAAYLASGINGEIEPYSKITEKAFVSILTIGVLHILIGGRDIVKILLVQGITLFVALNQPQQMFVLGSLTQLILIAYLIVKASYKLAVMAIYGSPQKPEEPKTMEAKIMVFSIPLLLVLMSGFLTLIFATLGVEVIVWFTRS